MTPSKVHEPPREERQPQGIQLPAWAVVSDKRRAHIGRVMMLIEQWADALHLPTAEAQAWSDAARWHDSLRDASETLLREITGDWTGDANLLHGPAAARRLERDGEARRDVLDAIRWHTVGSAGWGRTGRALYMADFLEPGRNFARADRAYLARQVPHDFDGTFRQVVQSRLDWALRDGKPLLPETVELWNALRC